MSKNTRWALALVGVVIIVVAAVAIGTGGDNSDATLSPDHAEHGQSQDNSSGDGATSSTGATSDSGGDDDANDNSGGAGPDASSDDNSGGAGPATGNSNSGAASPGSAVVSPVLTTSATKTVKVDKGKTVTIRARSGKAGTLHIHGYNKMVELKPNKTGSVTFKANIDGEFEIELHYTDGEAQIGTLRVSP